MDTQFNPLQEGTIMSMFYHKDEVRTWKLLDIIVVINAGILSQENTWKEVT